MTLYTSTCIGSNQLILYNAHSKNHKINEYYYDGAKKIRTKSTNEENNIIENEQDNLLFEKIFKDIQLSLSLYPLHSEHTKELIKLFYYITKNSNSLYVIGSFNNESESRFRIKGLNTWIVELFLKIHATNTLPYTNLPIYFFDKNTNQWFQMCFIENYKFNFISEVPRPTQKDIYTAVGTRTLNYNAIREINKLFS